MTTPQSAILTRPRFRLLSALSWMLSAICLVAAIFTLLAISANPLWGVSITETRMLTIQLVSTTLGTIVFGLIPLLVSGVRNSVWTLACIGTLGFGAFNALLGAAFVIVMLRQGQAMSSDAPVAEIAFGAAIPLALTATALAITLLRMPTGKSAPPPIRELAAMSIMLILRKRFRWVVLACVLAIALAIGLVWVNSGGDERPCGVAEVSNVRQPSTQPSDDGGIAVVDSGFAPYTPEMSEDETKASFGFMLRNTSRKELAYGLNFDFRIVDSDGEDAFHPDVRAQDETAYQDIYVPMLLPGEEVGMGSTIPSWQPTGRGTDSEIEPIDKPDYDELEVRIEVNTVEWWRPNNPNYEFKQLPATDGTPTIDEEQPEPERIEFDVDSPYCKPVAEYQPSTLMYQDGDIVGGTESAPNEHQAISAEYPPGKSTSDTTDTSEVEPDTITVFPYAGPLELTRATSK